MISVIIATRGRSGAIAEISLPSLLRQDDADFEVLVWDASGDDLTKNAVDAARPPFARRKIGLIYERAPRPGLASQRNDAVMEAKGDVIFFIDDDLALAFEAISTIAAYFHRFERLFGMGLPIAGPPHTPEKKGSKIKDLFYRIFFGRRDFPYRKIRASTNNVMPAADSPGNAEWLSGCCMAFRKTVFDELWFDEKLQRFGGYSLAEDVDFSHRVMLHFKEPLIIADCSYSVHHSSPGGRISEECRMMAAVYYNTRIIKDNFGRYKRCCMLPFLWEQRIGRTVAVIAGGYALRSVARGYIEYRKAIVCGK